MAEYDNAEIIITNIRYWTTPMQKSMSSWGLLYIDNELYLNYIAQYPDKRILPFAFIQPNKMLELSQNQVSQEKTPLKESLS